MVAREVSTVGGPVPSFREGKLKKFTRPAGKLLKAGWDALVRHCLEAVDLRFHQCDAMPLLPPSGPLGLNDGRGWVISIV